MSDRPEVGRYSYTKALWANRHLKDPDFDAHLAGLAADLGHDVVAGEPYDDPQFPGLLVTVPIHRA